MLSVIETVVPFPINNNIQRLSVKRHPIFKEQLSPTNRDHIKIGQTVKIVEKHNQRTTNYTTGKIKDILTKKKKHTRGIKVRLETGEVGRVIEIIG